MKWTEVQKVHAEAVSHIAALAERIPPERWTVPRAEGKWSPAEIIEHLIVTYDVVIAELHGGTGMRILTKWWLRIVLRLTYLPRILGGAWFPRGARAPREIRPSSTRRQSEAIAVLRERGSKFDDAVAAASRSGKRITHAYFGRLSLEDGVLFCARHIQHHEKQLSR